MEPHTISIFDKEIKFTDKSMFRVEQSKNAKSVYEGIYAHKDPVHAIRYYNNTTKAKGWRVRLVKDGDEFVIINKKTFA